MDFIEIDMGGDRLALRKDSILAVREFHNTPKEVIKDHPWLKNVESCTYINASSSGSFFCLDSYDAIMQQLRS